MSFKARNCQISLWFSFTCIKRCQPIIQVKSSQVTFIYIALLTIQIVSKQLHTSLRTSFVTFVSNVAVPARLQVPQFYLLTKATWWVLFTDVLLTFSVYETLGNTGVYQPSQTTLAIKRNAYMCVRARLGGGAHWGRPHPSLWGATPLCGIYCSWVTWPPLPPPMPKHYHISPSLSPLILLLYSMSLASLLLFGLKELGVTRLGSKREATQDCWLLLPAGSIFFSSCLSPAGQSLESSFHL